MAAASLTPPHQEAMDSTALEKTPAPLEKPTKSRKGKGKASGQSRVNEGSAAKIAVKNAASSSTTRDETWTWTTLAGSYSSQRAPVFTKDGK
jgi:hypothetical protein